MEDELKILKVEYFSNHFLDPTQIFNLSLDDQPILYKFLKWRRQLKWNISATAYWSYSKI